MRCEYFGWCGGCTSQDVAYPEQLLQKQKALRELFAYKGIELPEFQVQAGEQWHYRNRMDFTIFFKGFGLRRRGRYDFVEEIRQCPIANTRINEALTELWSWFDTNKAQLDHFHIRSQKGTLRQCTLRAPKFGNEVTAIFMLNSDSERLAEQTALLKDFAQNTKLDNVLLGAIPAKSNAGLPATVEVLKGSVLVRERLAEVPLTYHALGFAQGNPQYFLELLQDVRSVITQYSPRLKLIDLYGGAGTFGLYLSDLFPRVEIIDSEGVNIECAKATVALPQYAHVQVRCADADAVAEIEAKDAVMIVDPPRAGIHPKTLKKIIAAEAPFLIYVSCNPKQLAQEMPSFLEKYSLERFLAYDLFPNTLHSETVAFLKKR